MKKKTLMMKLYEQVRAYDDLIEVPDTLKSLKNNDFSCIWEQHKVYFTQNSLENCMNNFGYKINL